ncbi:MAG: CopG family antitoxin [Nitrospirota bacterium]
MVPLKTLDEEAEFWDTHDVSNLGKVPLLSLPLLETEKEEVMTVRLQKSVKRRIEQVARKMGLNASTLSRMWLIEKLSRMPTR